MSYHITSDDVPARPALVQRAHVPIDALSGWLHRCYRDLFSYVASRDVMVTGPPFGRYTFHDDGGVDVEAGVPVAAPVAAGGALIMSSLPAAKAATTCHVGPYERLVEASDALEKWIQDHGFERDGPHWEVYVTDPVFQPDPERRRTIVIMPYRAPTWGLDDDGRVHPVDRRAECEDQGRRMCLSRGR